MFEVNISSSERAASAAPKLDEVPTHVRSEHLLEVSMQWVLQSKLDEVPTVFEVNTSSRSGPQSSSEPHSKCCDLGEVPMGCSGELPSLPVPRSEG